MSPKTTVNTWNTLLNSGLKSFNRFYKLFPKFDRKNAIGFVEKYLKADLHLSEKSKQGNPDQHHIKKMNHIVPVLSIGLSILLFGCSQTSKSPEITAKPEIAKNSAVSDGHNSSNSLDVDGLYKGTLPCADCDGIETEIELGKDNSFVKRTIYLGKDGKVFEEKGFYTWNSEGNTIALSGIKSGPDQYFVGENKLIQLDVDGNRITGDLADKYVLSK